MFSFKDNVLYFSLFNVVAQISTLVQVADIEENDIANTETILRDTVNNLFVSFKIRDVKHKPRLKDFSILHNFFISLTLKDADNLQKIANLTRVSNIDNNTKHFIAQINEVLDENDSSDEENNIYVTKHIETFINKLRHLKDIHGLNNNFGNVSISSAILKLLYKNENILSNFTDEKHNANDTDESNLSDDEIWTPPEQSGRRIFSGHRTRVRYYPFMATVQFFEKFQCAASIIRKDMVITAASCIQLAWNNRFFRENPAFLSVQVGCDYYEAGGENIGVLDVFFHPEYQPTNLRNNIALLRLGTHIVFSKKITNVKRIRFDRRATPLPSNTDGISILGWGATDQSNVIDSPWRNRLRYAELDIYPLQECQEIYSKEYVTYKNFCAGFFTKGTGACNHDVGGPGMSGGILLGVISFGPPICGTPDAPTVFTKIGFYTSWIDGIIGQQVSQIVKLSTKRRPKSTFALHYSDTTRRPFTVRYITPGQPFPGYIAIPTSAGSLRILDDDKQFKDFMSTLFASREARDYEEPGDNEKRECSDEKPTKKVIKNKSKPSTARTSSSTDKTQDSEDKKCKDMTRLGIMKCKRSKNDSQKHNAANKSLPIDGDSKLDSDIKNLLDDLDLYKLLNSDEPLLNMDDHDDIAARAMEINESDDIDLNNMEISENSAENNAKMSQSKLRHKSLHKNKMTKPEVEAEPLSLGDDNDASKNIQDKNSLNKDALNSSDNDENVITRDEAVKDTNKIPSYSYEYDEGTTESAKVTKKSVKKIPELSDKSEYSDESNKVLQKLDKATFDTSNKDKGKENSKARKKAIKKLLYSTVREKNAKKNRKTSSPDQSLLNLSEKDDNSQSVDEADAIKKLSYSIVSGQNAKKNRKATSPIQSLLNLSEEDDSSQSVDEADAIKKSSYSIVREKNAKKNKKATSPAQTLLNLSEKDVNSQSVDEEDGETSGDNGGLSIVA